MSEANFSILIMFIIKLLYICAIYFDAKSDALIDAENKRKHGYELLTNLSFLFVICLVWYVPYNISFFTLISYVFLRMGLFNVVYNKYRGLPYHYVGTTDKWYDKWIKWMSKIESKPRKYKFPILTIWYFVVFFIGLFLF